MFGSSRKSPERLQTLDQVKAWTRGRFGLPQEATILVAEIACALPGCPPLETVVVFWMADGKQRRFKIFKPVEEVVCEDLPPAWLKDALAVPEGFDGECC
jgi:nitrate reductase delta subunit